MNNKIVNAILNEYFELIDSYFGCIKHHLGNQDHSHLDLSEYIANYPIISDLIYEATDDINDQINLFWKKNLDNMFEYICQQDSLKCIYSGDISPVILENFVKRSSLYIDTIILPDPVLKITNIQQKICFNKYYYLQKLIQHIFNIWKLKDLILMDLPQKIILIFPIDLNLIGEKKIDEMIILSEDKLTLYINKIFDLKFNNFQSCMDFLKNFTNSHKLFEKFKNIEMLPKTFRDQVTFNDFLNNFDKTIRLSKIESSKSLGWEFGTYLRSQFIRVQEHKLFCEKFKGEPIYDNELPWFFFNCETCGIGMDAAISNALMKENVKWITNIPLSAITLMRAENKLDYMRSILRKGITDLKAKNDQDLIKVGEQIEVNLKEAFSRQESEISLIQNQVNKITNNDIPIVSAGFLAGFIPLIGNVISLLFAGRDIKNAVEKRTKLKKEIKLIKNNFINILFKSYERTN